MALLLLFAGSLYAAALLLLTGGLVRSGRRFERARIEGAAGRESGSESAIVVVARNEETHLPSLLDALDRQVYPAGRLQIVIVDEGSTDRTGQILADFTPCTHRFHAMRTDAEEPYGSPKKAALAAAIDYSTVPNIILTDADTAPPPPWAVNMAAALAGGCPAVAGYSKPLPKRGLLGWAAGMWDLGAAGLAGGFIGLGIAVHVTGRNWGFHRKLYEDAGGYSGLEHILSGDDTLLAQKFSRCSPVSEWGFTMSPDCTVPTRPPAGFYEFIRQKRRHLATAKRFHPVPLLVSVISFLLFSCLWIALVSAPLRAWHPAAIWALALKVAADCVFLLFAAARSGQVTMALSSPPWSLVHLFIYPLLQLSAVFVPFRWKGRRGI